MRDIASPLSGFSGNSGKANKRIKVLTLPPNLFWPLNTAQSYNLAQHLESKTAMTFATADTLPAGITLSSAGVLSGTATESIAGFFVVDVTNAAGSSFALSVYLAITDVPDAYTAGMWHLEPVLNGLKVVIDTDTDMNSSGLVKRQYSINAGVTPLDLALDSIIPTTVARDVVIRAVNGIGPAATWSDSKNGVPITIIHDYPVVKNTTAFNGGSGNATSYTINAFASRAVGDTLLVVCAADGNPTITPSAGWNTLRAGDQGASGTGSQRGAIFWRTADGTSADNLTLSLSASENCVGRSWCFDGAITLNVGAPHNPSGTVAPNPPSLDVGAVKDALWIAATVYSGSGGSITSGNVPSGYTWIGNTLTADTSAGVGLGVATRENYTQVEDPPAFGQTIPQPITYTIAAYKSLVAPTLAVDITDQTFEQNTGGGAVDIAPSFSGASIVYTFSGGPAGTTINSETGLLTVPTANAGTWSITITATNGAGFANDSFGLTITAAAVPMATFTLAYGIDETFQNGAEIGGYDFVNGSGLPEQRYVCKSVSGRWHVKGDAGNPVRAVPRRAFVSETGFVRFWNGNNATGTRYRNGAMKNPYNLFTQGFDNYYYDPGIKTGWDATKNLNTGGAITVTDGVIVQAISRKFDNASDITQTGGDDAFGSLISGHGSFAVVASDLPVDFFAIPPAGNDKTLFTGLHAGMLHMDKLRSLDMSALPDQRSFKSIAADFSRLRNTWSIHNDKSRNMYANDGRPAPYGGGSVEELYSRDNMPALGRALIAAHRSPNESDPDNNSAMKKQMVCNVVQYGLDMLANLANGYDVAGSNGGGGGYEVGFGALCGFTAALFDLQWMKDLCAPDRLKPNGSPKYRNDSNSSKGVVGFGLGESNHYAYIDETFLGQNSLAYPVAGRSYPKPYQVGHIGMPDCCSGRITIESGKWHIAPNWDYNYKENRLSEVGPFVGAYLIEGMNDILGMAVAIQYFDRAVVAQGLGKMRSEAGLTDLGRAAFNAYRGLLGVPVLNIQPDQPDPPIITQWVGSGDRLGIRRLNTNLDHGSPILGSKIYYRTTTPPRYEQDDGGWTGPITIATAGGLSKTDDYMLTGLSPTQQYWITFCDYNANGDGPRSTNLRAKTSARTEAEGLTAPQGVGTTDTNQPIAYTTDPYIIGGTMVGDEAYVHPGVATIPPTGGTFQWKRNGSNISGATSRGYVRQTADIGATLTCEHVPSNSSSSLTFTLTAPATVAASARSATVVGAATKADTGTASTNNRTRKLALTQTLSHPVSTIVATALVPWSSTTTDIGTLRAVLRNSAASAVSLTSGVNELVKAESVSGNLRTSARVAAVDTTATGAVSAEVNTNQNGASLGLWTHAMACIQTLGFNASGAMTGKETGTTNEADTTLYEETYDAEAVIGQTNGSGTVAVVPKGSLIVAVVSAGRHFGPVAPIWGGVVAPIDGATYFGKFQSEGATVAIAMGIQAETGPCTVTCSIAGNPERFAMSVAAIPPA